MSKFTTGRKNSRKTQYRDAALLFVGIATCSAFVPLTFYTSVFDNVVLPILQLCPECATVQFFKPFVFALEFTAIVASGLAIAMSSLYLYEKIKASKSMTNRERSTW